MNIKSMSFTELVKIKVKVDAEIDFVLLQIVPD